MFKIPITCRIPRFGTGGGACGVLQRIAAFCGELQQIAAFCGYSILTITVSRTNFPI
jgi:hypothetical protein